MTDEPWIVMRWSGREGDAHRKVFEGTEEKARRKYDKLHAEMRQGGVELIDGDGKAVKRDRASRRTQSSLTLVIECDRLRTTTAKADPSSIPVRTLRGRVGSAMPSRPSRDLRC